MQDLLLAFIKPVCAVRCVNSIFHVMYDQSQNIINEGVPDFLFLKEFLRITFKQLFLSCTLFAEQALPVQHFQTIDISREL